MDISNFTARATVIEFGEEHESCNGGRIAVEYFGNGSWLITRTNYIYTDTGWEIIACDNLYALDDEFVNRAKFPYDVAMLIAQKLYEETK
jgi:hypothetical protein